MALERPSLYDTVRGGNGRDGILAIVLSPHLGEKLREPMIVGDREEIITQAVSQKAREYEVIVHALGYMPDHMHLSVSIPSKHAPSKFVQGVKGLASRNLNRDSREPIGHFS